MKGSSWVLHPGAIWLECLKGIPRSSGSALLSLTQEQSDTGEQWPAVLVQPLASESEPKLVLCLEGKLGN